jgi:hypothetical protein
MENLNRNFARLLVTEGLILPLVAANRSHCHIGPLSQDFIFLACGLLKGFDATSNEPDERRVAYLGRVTEKLNTLRYVHPTSVQSVIDAATGAMGQKTSAYALWLKVGACAFLGCPSAMI